MGTRFVTSLIPPLLLLVGLLGLISAGVARMPGGWGVAASVGGGILIGLGVLLARAVLRDLRSLRRIRAHGYTPGMALEDGQVLAIDGELACDEPLTAPISGIGCAAWLARISERRRVAGGGSSDTRRVFIAAGVAAVPFRLVAQDRTFPVRAMPEVDESLRLDGQGCDHREAMAAFFQRLLETETVATEPGSIEGVEERRLALQEGLPGPVTALARRFESSPDPEGLSVREEHVPVGTPVCLLGNFDVAGGALVRGRGPLGRAVHLYAGSRPEVVERLSGEVRGFGIAAVILLASGAGLLSIPFLFAG